MRQKKTCRARKVRARTRSVTRTRRRVKTCRRAKARRICKPRTGRVKARRVQPAASAPEQAPAVPEKKPALIVIYAGKLGLTAVEVKDWEAVRLLCRDKGLTRYDYTIVEGFIVKAPQERPATPPEVIEEDEEEEIDPETGLPVKELKEILSRDYQDA